MPFHDSNDFDLYSEELESLPRIKNLPLRARGRAGGKLHKPRPRPSSEPPEAFADAADREQSFDFTYAASRHERVWIEESLGGFYEQHWIDDVLRQVKGGKEASVYLCTAGQALGGEHLAAKVYRPRVFRSLKNDHVYREGRDQLDENGHVIHNAGDLHAIKKRTEYGRELMHTSWIEHEVKTLQILRAAGADVPEVFVSGDNAILMTYIGNGEMAAPTLNAVHLDRQEARRLFDRVLHNIRLMLSADRIHGDLSAYNILYWEGEITLIDFPQAVEPEVNPHAYPIFQRDVTRICEYFQSQGVPSDAGRLAAALWQESRRRLTADLEPALLDPEDDEAVALWKQQGT